MRKTCVYLGMTVAILSLAACNKPAASGGDGSAGGSAMPAASTKDASANLAAANPMGRKPGLWEMTNTVDGAQIGGVNMKTVMCIDATLGEKMAKTAGQMKSDVDCSKRDIMAMPNGAMIDQVCTSGKTTVTSHIEITAPNDSEFHQVIDSKFSPAVAGHEETKVTVDGKWLGACPSTMKAGDVQLPGGVVVNMGNMMDKMKK